MSDQTARSQRRQEPCSADFAATLGARIRQERLSRRPRMTLADLARDQLSIAVVSRVERGEVTPSLGTLRYLARRLGRPMAFFLADEAAGERERLWSQALSSAALLLLGESETAIDLAEAVLGAKDVPSSARAVALTVKAAALLALRRGGEAATDVEAAVREVTSSSPAPVVSAAAWLVAGEVHAATGDPVRAKKAWAQAGDYAMDTELTTGLRPLALLRLAQAAAEGGVAETGTALLQQAADPSDQAADPTVTAHSFLHAAREAGAAGDSSAAFVWAAGALSLAGWLAARPLVSTVGAWRARLELDSGHWRGALAHLAEAVEYPAAGAPNEPSPLIGQVAADVVRELHQRQAELRSVGAAPQAPPTAQDDLSPQRPSGLDTDAGASPQTGTGDNTLAVARAHRTAGDLERFTQLALSTVEQRAGHDRTEAIAVLLEIGESWANAGAAGRALTYFRRAAGLSPVFDDSATTA
ncbi:MAG: hypothetical protein CL878_06245 [Dehalococcoidia bacterium]|nr:hypothetical protein [Dehalococcoidia bacterium]